MVDGSPLHQQFCMNPYGMFLFSSLKINTCLWYIGFNFISYHTNEDGQRLCNAIVLPSSVLLLSWTWYEALKPWPFERIILSHSWMEKRKKKPNKKGVPDKIFLNPALSF